MLMTEFEGQKNSMKMSRFNYKKQLVNALISSVSNWPNFKQQLKMKVNTEKFQKVHKGAVHLETGKIPPAGKFH